MTGRAAALIAWVTVLAASPAAAEDLLRTFAWDRLRAEGRVAAGEVVPPDAETPFHALRVRADRPGSVTLLTIRDPGVLGRGFTLAGRVRHSGTAPETFIEMLVYVPAGGPWFSRHAAAGDGDWTDFRLPFRLDGGTPPPEKIVLNVIFSGGGTVELGPLRLLQSAPGEDPFQPGAWWDGRTAGWIGAVLGTVLGLLGAAIGTCAGLGVARAFVLGALQSVTVLGFVLLAWGVAALALGQPYAVFYPLLLGGVLCGVLGVSLARPLRARYEKRPPAGGG